ncbi:MAG: hypothetical protein KBC11_01400 [Candidatus Pacebacteria bacterium]|nr:hypothetical protein [Candidatus Paceibacterota bacterium]
MIVNAIYWEDLIKAEKRIVESAIRFLNKPSSNQLRACMECELEDYSDLLKEDIKEFRIREEAILKLESGDLKAWNEFGQGSKDLFHQYPDLKKDFLEAALERGIEFSVEN